jgi:FKBP-type peptidyl-prolyl cis-trans isomerase
MKQYFIELKIWSKFICKMNVASVIPNRLVQLILIYLILSCSSSPYPGFSYQDDIYFKVLTFGDDHSKRLSEASHVDISVCYVPYFSNDECCGDESSYLIDLSNTSDKLLSFLQSKTEEDSVHLLVSGALLKSSFLPNTECQFHDTALVEIRLKINKLFDELEYFAYQRAKMKDLEMEEQENLLKYLKREQIDVQRSFKEGIYFIPLRSGNGKYAESGAELVIHYRGFFVDNTLFDSTYEENSPLVFNFGDPDQVIRGFEIALAGMRKGDKAKVIIPSHLAFGENGSSSKIVPPYTTVIYELELVKVN